MSGLPLVFGEGQDAVGAVGVEVNWTVHDLITLFDAVDNGG